MTHNTTTTVDLSNVNYWLLNNFRILVRFGPVIPEFMLLRRYGKNRHITSNISECPGPILTYFTGLVGILVRMIIPIFVWRSPNGRCYGNQLNLGMFVDIARNDLYSLLWRSTTDPTTVSRFQETRSIWEILDPFATASRRTPPVLILHCRSPGVATVDTTTKMSRSQL